MACVNFISVKKPDAKNIAILIKIFHDKIMNEQYIKISKEVRDLEIRLAAAKAIQTEIIVARARRKWPHYDHAWENDYSLGNEGGSATQEDFRKWAKTELDTENGLVDTPRRY